MARRFHNPDPAHRPHSMRAVFRWGVVDRLLGRRRIRAPGPPAPRVEPDLSRIHRTDGGPRLTWIGHSSFLCTAGGVHFLIDPVFSEQAGWLYRRFVAPGLRPPGLPPLHALLVTHAHYDHLDAASVLALPRDIRVFVPRGLGRWFRRRGFREARELGWWEVACTESLRVTLVPARHWSRRRIADTNRTLWGGFVVEAGGTSLYHAGDSAYFDGFREIGRRCPRLLAAMLPIGAYSPAWFMEHHHLSPEQAGRAFLELGARYLVPMHWGAFKLSDEPLSEPARRMRTWWREHAPADRVLCLPAVGETLELDGTDRAVRA